MNKYLCFASRLEIAAYITDVQHATATYTKHIEFTHSETNKDTPRAHMAEDSDVPLMAM
jgi:hypothetical protein